MQRLLSGVVLVLVATALHAIGQSFVVGMSIWFGIAVAIGLVFARWRALILAVIPWPLGIGIGLAAGRYAFLGEFWQIPAAFSVAAGLAGIAAGVLARRSLVPER